MAVEPRAQRVDWLGDVFFDEEAEEEETPCGVCGRDDDAATLLLCDAPGCNGACHVACAGLPAVPDGDWLCARCADALAEAAPAEQAEADEAPAPAPQDALFERFRLTTQPR